MSLVGATRLARFPHLATRRPLARPFSTAAPPRPRSGYARHLIAAGLLSSVAGGSLYAYKNSSVIYADVGGHEANGRVSQVPPPPLSELVRTYIVYSLCSVPFLVDWSPTILSTLMAIPGLKQITEAVVRVTFFDQFVGGDEAEDVVPVLERLRRENKGALFVYSVEVDESAASGAGKLSSSEKPLAHKQIVQENLHCIDVAADFEDRHAHGNAGKGTWVAIKLSALVPDAESLRRLSKFLVDSRPRSNPYIPFPGCPSPSDLDVLASGHPNEALTAADVAALRELREDLAIICERAQARGIRITVDAEHSWYQPAIDAFTMDMMRKFNKLPKAGHASWFGWSKPVEAPSGTFQPLIYNTFQGYLRRTPEYLAQSIAAARAEGYSLGVKLVRGAYHPHEIEIHRASSASRASVTTSSPRSGTHDVSISPDNMPPVWLTKDETDTCYDSSVRMLISLVREDVEACKRTGSPPSIGALFGTHNWDSANLVVDELVKQGLAKNVGDGKVFVSDEAMQRVAVAQLYGMSDELTNHLVERAQASAPFVLKYLPYGNLAEVMPYLSRRAIENKSVLGNGGAARERRRVASAIWTRLFG
ncbi:FAD-linked oxidoreductase [Polyporus arcularius HHB13444]|uniref:Proline dehydrogenase n=1 Tax=Polyporus arcularius HHB13444 TaxID=1314778 RepID=A0A5C3P8U1_9APHY|nr:FAD-linked oxidoreductase [Polyporus arcularius HHB13444]